MVDPVNGSVFNLPIRLKWPTVLIGVLLLTIVVDTWAIWSMLQSETNSRVQRAVIMRDAMKLITDRGLEHTKLTNELKLETLVRALPVDEQRLVIPMLFDRLSEDAQARLLSLKLRSLGVIQEHDTRRSILPRRYEGP